MSIKKHRPVDEDEGQAAPAAAPAAKKVRLADGTEVDEPAWKREKREKKERKKQEKREKREKKLQKVKTEKRENKYRAQKELRMAKRGDLAETPEQRKKREKKEKKKADKAAKKQAEQAAKGAAKAEAESASEAEAEAESASESESESEAEVAAETAKPVKEAKEAKEDKATKTPKTPKTPKTSAAPASGAYTQTEALTAVPEAVVQAFLKKEQVAIHDPRATDGAAASQLRPILDFAQLPATALTKQAPFAAYAAPTPIQAASWPYTLGGRDLVGIAETGSGKTMAFALPCVEALCAAPRPAAVAAREKLPHRSRVNVKHEARAGGGQLAQARAVIVSPTRELAMQTHAALAPLAARVGLTAVCVYGGASKDDQRVQLRQAGGVDILVATPGRLKDFLADEAVSLAHARFAVLDEADRMLDTGFEDDIRLILGQCPDRTQRQTLMFTATWPTSVRGLAEGFMVDPVKVTVGGQTRAGEGAGGGGDGGGGDGADSAASRRSNTGAVELQANARITQTVEVLDQRDKERRLLAILKQEQRGKARDDRILVFCLYKKEAVRVENFLQGQGIRVCSIHGNLRQDQRTRSLDAFKTGTTPVLVATDVAARGLDIPEVKLVINVTFPLTIEDYVHRIGRTGRAGKEGRAITFFTELDKAHSGSLINVLKGANQEVPEDLMKFGTTVKKKAHSTYGAFFKDVDMSQKGKKITFD